MEFQVTEKRSVDGRSSESINPRKQVSKCPAGVANLFLFHSVWTFVRDKTHICLLSENLRWKYVGMYVE